MLLPGIVAFLVPGVTFSAPAEPASRLLPELGKAVGVPLAVDSKLRQEVLLVRVRNVPLAELMKRVAQASGGEWEKGDDGYRLTLSKATDAKQRKAEARARGEDYLHWIRMRQGAVANGRGGSQPVSAVDQLLADLDPSTLGSMGLKERVVFSTSPTAMQRPLPTSVLSGIDFSKIQTNQAIQSVNGQPVVQPRGPMASAQLVLQSYANGQNVTVLLSTEDAQGRTIASESNNLYPYEEGAPPRALPKPLHPEASAAGTPEERQRAVLLTRLVTVSENFGGSAEDQDPTVMYSDADLAGTPTAEAMPEILRPEAVDPLALTVEPLLAGLATGEGTNLVAVIPDRAFSPACALLARKEVRTSDLLGAARRELGLDVSFEPGWTVVAPREPARARDGRLDRAALGKALRALARDHALSLDAQAAYVVAEPLVASRETFEAPLFGAIDVSFGKRIAASSENGERQTLRLYAAVGKVGKAPQTFGNLPSAAQETLRDMVFNGVSGPRIVAPQGDGSNFGAPRGPYGAPDALAAERTVFWGGGIPLGAVLTVGEETESSMFGLAPNGVRAKMSDRSSAYGIRGDSKGGYTTSTTHPRLEKYQRGTVRHLRFTLRGTPSVEFTRSLESTSLDPNAPVLPYAELPEGLRKQIESVQEGVRRMIEQNRQRPTNARP